MCPTYASARTTKSKKTNLFVDSPTQPTHSSLIFNFLQFIQTVQKPAHTVRNVPVHVPVLPVPHVFNQMIFNQNVQSHDFRLRVKKATLEGDTVSFATCHFVGFIFLST